MYHNTHIQIRENDTHCKVRASDWQPERPDSEVPIQLEIETSTMNEKGGNHTHSLLTILMNVNAAEQIASELTVALREKWDREHPEEAAKLYQQEAERASQGDLTNTLPRSWQN